jgi:hypothetical protein
MIPGMSKRRIQQTDRPRGKHGTRAHLVGGGTPLMDGNVRVQTLLSQIDRHGLAWDDVADEILPIFERARPSSSDVEPPAQAVVPPGVTIGFGIDLGLAFARVAEVHLDRWPVDLAGLTDRALRNLRRRARRARDYDLVAEPIGGIPTLAFQSRDGWASTTVLVPDAMQRLFGPGPALFIAPSRDLLVGLPIDVDMGFATWLAEEFEAADPNALRLEGFEWRDGTIRCRPLQRDAVAV